MLCCGGRFIWESCLKPGLDEAGKGLIYIQIHGPLLLICKKKAKKQSKGVDKLNL
jgi:hypothetical protein